jgi:hypothetical protein
MKNQKPAFCAICGEPRRENDGWFLLSENRWTDRLKILRWNDQLASHPAAYPACGAVHVQQLVVHWMVTGSLTHPFARVPGSAEKLFRKARRNPPQDGSEADTEGAAVIGELAVHRESLSRILVESPESLASILEALISAISTERQPVHLEKEEDQKDVFELVEI